MKPTSLALAAALITSQASCAASPVFAQETAPCSDITQDMPFNVFIVTQRADTVKQRFCLSFASDDPRIKDVTIRGEDGVSKAQNCLDMKGAATQTLTPVITFADNDTRELPPLGMDQAKDVYDSMSQACIVAHPASYTPVRFDVPEMR